MKRFLFFLLILSTLLSFIVAFAEEAVVYEAEKAVLTGGITAKTEATASGWKTVGTFEKSEDTVIFTITIPEDGTYDLLLTCKGIGGSKINNLLVDGVQQGTFECGNLQYEDAPVRGVLLTAGEHTVTVTPSWGWMYLDKLTVVRAQGIDNAVYEVSPTLINPNATENAKKLYTWLCDIYGTYTLSGQVCDKGLKGTEFKAIHDVTGKYPAMLGLDMMDYPPSRRALGASNPNAVERAIEFHKEGGLVTFCWHWTADKKYILDGKDENGNPRWWGGFYT